MALQHLRTRAKGNMAKKKMYKTVISDTHVGHNQEAWLLLKKSLYLRKNSTGDKSCLLLETSKFDTLTEVMDLRKVSTVCILFYSPTRDHLISYSTSRSLVLCYYPLYCSISSLKNSVQFPVFEKNHVLKLFLTLFAWVLFTFWI